MTSWEKDAKLEPSVPVYKTAPSDCPHHCCTTAAAALSHLSTLSGVLENVAYSKQYDSTHNKCFTPSVFLARASAVVTAMVQYKESLMNRVQVSNSEFNE
jgi:hypothetical protein